MYTLRIKNLEFNGKELVEHISFKVDVEKVLNETEEDSIIQLHLNRDGKEFYSMGLKRDTFKYYKLGNPDNMEMNFKYPDDLLESLFSRS
jgi:hypothetical protein